MENDDALEILVRPARELLGRAASLAALGRRGLIEDSINGDLMSAETEQFELQAWARVELCAWMEPEDLHVLQAPVGSLIDEEATHCADALVSASTIGWCASAVRLNELPLLSDGSVERQTLKWVPGPWTQVRGRLSSVHLRTDEVLARERERWELIVWRMSLFVNPENRRDDESALRDVGVEVQQVGLVAWIDGDFALEDGTAFRSLDEDQREQLAAESLLRLHAMNWVCGFGAGWEDVPLFLD